MTVLIFIGLKLAEIAVGIFLPYYIGRALFLRLEPDFTTEGGAAAVLRWCGGIATLIVVSIAGFFLWILLQLNWEWAQVISGKA